MVQKMSKSEESDFSRINLKDNADEILKKLKKLNQTQSQIPENLHILEKKTRGVKFDKYLR